MKQLHPEYYRPGRSVLTTSTLLLSLASSWLCAQEAPAPKPITPSPTAPATTEVPSTKVADTSLLEDGETISLSPFEVTADNKGYYAANTMSGTRLNSRLEDLGSAISVVTKEQMSDFALLNVNDVFLYEASTEGPGNFTDIEIDRRGNAVDNLSNNPNGANRIRGVGPANNAFGNFATSGRAEVDPTMMESLEISRGPNSNIFGLGGAAGTVNVNPATANLQRNRAQLQMRADSYDGYRSHLDINQVLKQGVLAIRGSAVFQHDGFIRKPSGVDNERYNLMVKYQPFKYTTLRAGYYTLHTYGTRTNSVTPRDAVTPWKEGGRPSWNPVTQRYTINGVDSGVIAVGGAVPPSLRYLTDYITRGQYFIDPNGQTITVGRVTTNANPSNFTTGGQPIRYMESGLGSTRTNQPLFSTIPSITDATIYDWNEVNLAAINSIDERNAQGIAELEQIFINTSRHLLAAQLGYFNESSKRHSRNPIGAAAAVGTAGFLEVDVNSHLLDGTVNPNFGRTFISAAEPWDIRDNLDIDTGRAQLAYRLDFSQEKNWKAWLGMHQLAGYHEYKETVRRLRRYRDVIIDGTPFTPANFARGNQSGNASQDALRGYYRYYLGDNSGTNVDYAPTALRYGANTFRYRNENSAWINLPVTVGQAAVTDGLTGTVNSQNTRNIVKSDGVVLQSHLLRGRVITTFGIRDDTSTTMFGQSAALDASGLQYNDAITNSFSGVWNETSGRTKTSGVVVKPLPWLSVFYNQSDSFVPSTPEQNLMKQKLSDPTGEGEDYGFQLTLLHGKLVIRANQYDVLQTNSRFGQSGTFAQRIIAQDYDFYTQRSWALDKQAKAWVTAANPTFTEDQIAAEVTRQTGLSANDLAEFQALPINDVADIQAKGKEVEVNYNPTKNWTLKLNVVQQESIESNISKSLLQRTEARLATWQNIIDTRTGLNWWTTRYGTNNDTPASVYAASIIAPIRLQMATEGTSKPQVRKYRVNASTNYALKDLFENRHLKRVNVGGAVRWEDKGAIGYYGKQSLPDQILEYDADRPVWSESNTYIDLFVGYKTRLFSDKVGAKFQLNVVNVTEDGHLQPIAAYPSGYAHSYRIVDPRKFILTVTFDL